MSPAHLPLSARPPHRASSLGPKSSARNSASRQSPAEIPARRHRRPHGPARDSPRVPCPPGTRHPAFGPQMPRGIRGESSPPGSDRRPPRRPHFAPAVSAQEDAFARDQDPGPGRARPGQPCHRPRRSPQRATCAAGDRVHPGRRHSRRPPRARRSGLLRTAPSTCRTPWATAPVAVNALTPSPPRLLTPRYSSTPPRNAPLPRPPQPSHAPPPG